MFGGFCPLSSEQQRSKKVRACVRFTGIPKKLKTTAHVLVARTLTNLASD